MRCWHDARAIGVVAILTIMVIYVTIVYGPIAAALVEFFPTRIRYTAMSLPYHIGNGWFGGLLPATSFAMVASTGDIYYGLWYPIGFALLTCCHRLPVRPGSGREKHGRPPLSGCILHESMEALPFGRASLYRRACELPAAAKKL